jgi:hypothetical protein
LTVVSLFLEDEIHSKLTTERHSPNVDRTRQRSINGNLVVVQLRNNVMLSELSLWSRNFDDLAQGISWGMLDSRSGHYWIDRLRV